MRKRGVLYVKSNSEGYRLALLADNSPRFETDTKDRAYKEGIH